MTLAVKQKIDAESHAVGPRASDRPLLYDLYCGAGGATRGYQMAGFRVIGIDNRPQPRYCGDGFLLMDVFEFMRRYLAGEYERAAAFAASPPCQCYAVTQNIWHNQSKHPDLVAPTREALIATGRPYIIENVPGAPLVNPIVLCGAMFGLQVYRHRIFESTVWLMAPSHVRHVAKASYGHRPKAGEFYTVSGHFSDLAGTQKAMGIDWMGRDNLAQAIPPAYCEFIGRQLLSALHDGGRRPGGF